jgi:DNA-binding transcriptional regulator YiaG
MNAAQFRDAQERLGITNTTAARLLGVDARTTRRWGTGERAVPEPVARLLRLMLVMHLVPEQVLTLLRTHQNTTTE